MSEFEDTTVQAQGHPLDGYKVSLVDEHHVKTPAKYKCAYCYLSSMAFLMTLLSTFILGSSLYIYVTNIVHITYDSELFLMILGFSVLLMSIFLWVSICNYTNGLAKIALLVVSIYSFSIFAISTVTTIYSGIYFESNGMINSTEVNKLLNDTIYYTYEVCCKDKNSTSISKNVCYDVLGHNDTTFSYECSSFNRFEMDFYKYLYNIFVWLLAAGGITAVINLITGVTSCCLVSAYKRIVNYKY